MARPRMEKLSDLVPMAAYLFADRLTYDPATLVTGKLDGERTAVLLKIAQWELEKLRQWNKDRLQEVFNAMAGKEGLKLRELVAPFYVAISGDPSALPLFDSMEILGSDLTRRRLQYALEALEGAGFPISAKKFKKLEGEYRERYG
ncbi:MAG: hypothetical protein M1457_06935 [bacterium]|nr:hypothetical protein [bacterium]